MKLFRSHIVRFSGFIMLMAGIALHYVKPADTENDHTAFTNWLESHLKTQDMDVLDKLDALSSQDADLESVIRQASELVTSHSDDFELPVSEEETSSEANYHLLLTEWKNYQSAGSGMGKAVLIQNIKPQTIPPGDGHALAKALVKRTIQPESPELSGLDTKVLSPGNSYTLSPFKSGTAINAP